MGNKFSVARKPETPVNSAEGAAPEKKAPEEPKTTQPGDSGMTQTVETEKLDVVVGESVTQVACLPNEECISECKAAEAAAAAAASDPLSAPEPVAKETPAPVEPEPLVSPPQPEPVAEAQLSPELAPEPVPEPEPTPVPEAEVEADPEPTSEPVSAPAETPELEADLPTQESVPEPSSLLIDLGVPDVTPQLINTTPSQFSIPDPVDADESTDIPEGEENAEEAAISTSEPEDTPESLEKPMEEEADGDLEQQVNDLTEENVSGLLTHLKLTGNDLLADLTHSDVKIPDDTPIVDISTSTELM
ncbi:uncharacterized protein ACBR49_003132 [Aulostomus maculatus]